MQLHGQGKVPPTLRFYGWRPPCISIGYFQSLERDIDLDKCLELGVDYVRRPSGGRAVLHDEELTYSLVASEKDSRVSGEIKASYMKINSGVVEGLRLLGIEVEVGQGGRRRRDTASPLCFHTLHGHEPTVGGRKVVGSSQVRKRGIILQQGTILLGIDEDKPFLILRMPDENVRRQLKSSFRRDVASLKEILMREVELEEVAEAVTRGFERALDVLLVEGELSGEEKALAQRLVRERYGRREWNLKR